MVQSESGIENLRGRLHKITYFFEFQLGYVRKSFFIPSVILCLYFKIPVVLAMLFRQSQRVIGGSLPAYFDGDLYIKIYLSIFGLKNKDNRFISDRFVDNR